MITTAHRTICSCGRCRLQILCIIWIVESISNIAVVACIAADDWQTNLCHATNLGLSVGLKAQPSGIHQAGNTDVVFVCAFIKRRERHKARSKRNWGSGQVWNLWERKREIWRCRVHQPDSSNKRSSYPTLAWTFMPKLPVSQLNFDATCARNCLASMARTYIYTHTIRQTSSAE